MQSPVMQHMQLPRRLICGHAPGQQVGAVQVVKGNRQASAAGKVGVMTHLGIADRAVAVIERAGPGFGHCGLHPPTT